MPFDPSQPFEVEHPAASPVATGGFDPSKPFTVEQPKPSVARDVAMTAATTPNRFVSGILGAPGDIMNMVGHVLQPIDHAKNALLKAILPDSLGPTIDAAQTRGDALAAEPNNQPGSYAARISHTLDSPVLPAYTPQTTPGKATALGIDLAVPLGQAAIAARVPMATKILNATTQSTRGALEANSLSQASKDATLAYDAGQRQGVNLLAPDVGGRGTKMVYQTLKDSPVAGDILQNAAKNNIAQLQAARGNVASSVAVPGDATTIGEHLQGGAQSYIAKSSNLGSRLYDRAFSLAGDAKINPENAVAALDQHISELSATSSTNASQIKALSDIKSDLVDASGQLKPLDIKSFRDLRTSTRDKLLSDNLLGTNAERRVNQVMDGVAQDIEASLANKPEALAAFQRADKFWGQRADRVNNALALINDSKGKISAEAAATKLNRFAGTGGSANFAALNNIMKSMPPEDSDAIVSSIINNIGSKDGRFSPDMFVTQWGQMSPRAKNLFFSKKPGLSQSLDDLARVSSAMKETEALANRSGTARNIATGSQIGAFIAGLIIDPVKTAATATAVSGGQYGLGKLMTSKAFVGWLADSGRATIKAGSMGQVAADRTLAAQMSKLTGIAKANPAIAGDIAHLQDALTRAPSYAGEKQNVGQ